ncbi:hypothetical protein ACFWGN_14910 [Oerskovia sp. NPDC060338]|uniref:hypothetical protein n=1 Tax=Oerskovia sp. NPDC060338 TaxID=3347100 RepID=UPI003662F2B5
MAQTFTLADPQWVLVEEDPDEYVVLPAGTPFAVRSLDGDLVEVEVPGHGIETTFPTAIGSFADGAASGIVLDRLSWADVAQKLGLPTDQ